MTTEKLYSVINRPKLNKINRICIFQSNHKLCDKIIKFVMTNNLTDWFLVLIDIIYAIKISLELAILIMIQSCSSVMSNEDDYFDV